MGRAQTGFHRAARDLAYAATYKWVAQPIPHRARLVKSGVDALGRRPGRFPVWCTVSHRYAGNLKVKTNLKFLFYATRAYAQNV
ncbi:hypothetical protein GCM10009720_28350 [Yaniella flava]|uniref:Uncharacterized protein n=1 Tax=Yaniella flava TaxID=287930 RepID=A0ABN2V445_9MICC